MIAAFLWVATTGGVCLPSSHDAHGWGLRIHNFTPRAPYLRGERLARMQFDVTLLNFSKDTREHDPLPVARATDDLRLLISRPNGRFFSATGFPQGRDPFTQPIRLRSGEFSYERFDFREFRFGLCHVTEVGRHRIVASMKIDGKVIQSPPVEFEVVAVPPSAVLVSHAVPLEGRGAKESARPVVQQVPVGGRTLLIYRYHYDPTEVGGGPYFTTRIAELPGKCEMTVEGAYGDGNPLTITYKTAPDAKPTTLVINSLTGSPWAEEEERLRQERLRAKDNPPPQVIKP